MRRIIGVKPRVRRSDVTMRSFDARPHVGVTLGLGINISVRSDEAER